MRLNDVRLQHLESESFNITLYVTWPSMYKHESVSTACLRTLVKPGIAFVRLIAADNETIRRSLHKRRSALTGNTQ